MKKVKRILAGVLAIVMSFGSDSVVMAASPGLQELEQENVTEIKSAEELVEIADDLSGNYCLVKDIDLSDVQWKALGSKNEPFTGSFDGNGHIISHMSMELSAIEENSCLGLFGVMKNAHVFNVALEETDISCKNADGIYAGAIAGKMANSVVKNCNVRGQMSFENLGTYTIGGLVGAVFQNNNISKTEYNVSECVSDVNIVLDGESQGKAGELAGYAQNSAIIRNSYT